MIDTEQWYECSEPADYPVMTCILAPEWGILPTRRGFVLTRSSRRTRGGAPRMARIATNWMETSASVGVEMADFLGAPRPLLACALWRDPYMQTHAPLL